MNDNTANDDTPEPQPRRPSLPNFVSFVMAVALVWLGGQFVRQGVSDHMLDDNPETAMLWMGDSSDALAHLARAGLRNDPSGAARLSVRALKLAPLNASALTTYGLAMNALHQRKIANRAMTLAGQRGWRDLITQIWLFRRDLLTSDFNDAFNHGDALLRRVPDPPPAIFSILAAAVATEPTALAPLTEHLIANPTWRQSFFIYLCLQAQPPQTDIADKLLTRLAASPSPPTDAEVGIYLFPVARQKQYQRAEAAWRRLTPGGANDGYVHNGDFERPMRTTPFDWLLSNGPGWSAATADSPDASHGKALRLDYDSISTPRPVRQLVVLPPGNFKLSGRVMETNGPQGFSWRVLCLGATASKEVAFVPALAGVDGQWRTISTIFTVPGDDCPAQLLDLVVLPADLTKQTTVWYDDMSIVPAPPGAEPSQPSVADHPDVAAKP